MSAFVGGQPGDYFVVLSQEQYDMIAELDGIYGTNTLNNNGNPFQEFDGNYYAKRDEIFGDEADVWIEWGIIGSTADLAVEFITLSVQANIFS